MIVGVPHRPTGGMPSRFLAIRPVHSPHVSVRPFAPGIVFHYLKRNRIIEIAFAGARDFIESPPRFDLSRKCTLRSLIHDPRAQRIPGGGMNLPSERSSRLCPTPDEDAAVAGCRRQSLTSSATPRDSCRENGFIPLYC